MPKAKCICKRVSKSIFSQTLVYFEYCMHVYRHLLGFFHGAVMRIAEVVQVTSVSYPMATKTTTGTVGDRVNAKEYWGPPSMLMGHGSFPEGKLSQTTHLPMGRVVVGKPPQQLQVVVCPRCRLLRRPPVGPPKS